LRVKKLLVIYIFNIGQTLTRR